MPRKLTPSDFALWAALPMAHTPRMEERLTMILDTTRPRRALTRRVLMAALGVGAAALIPLAMLRPAARAAPLPFAAMSRQHTVLAEPKDESRYGRQLLLLSYYGQQWFGAHPDAVGRAVRVRPLRAAALYGSWAEAYGGIRSGKTELFLRHAQALEPNNPQWADRLGNLYSVETINASPEVAQMQAKKALAEYEIAAHLLGDGSGVSESMVVAAFGAGEYDKARQYANDLLRRNEESAVVDQAGGFPYDDERHHAHLILGRLALRDGDAAGAEAHLLAMGRVSGSPNLDTFGPNMQLAQDLLKVGKRHAVLAYFDECAKFWTFDHGAKLKQWKAQVQKGEVPDFGGNLVY